MELFLSGARNDGKYLFRDEYCPTACLGVLALQIPFGSSPFCRSTIILCQHTSHHLYDFLWHLSIFNKYTAWRNYLQIKTDISIILFQKNLKITSSEYFHAHSLSNHASIQFMSKDMLLMQEYKNGISLKHSSPKISNPSVVISKTIEHRLF